MKWTLFVCFLVVLNTAGAKAYAVNQTLALADSNQPLSAEEIATQVYFVDHFYSFENITMGYRSANDMLLLSYSDNDLKEIKSERMITHQPQNAMLKTQDLVIFKSGKLRGTGILVDDFQAGQSMQVRMWLPALRKIRRFSEPDQDDVWGGSQLSYGDLYLRRPEHETHQFVTPETAPDCLDDIRYFKVWAADYQDYSFANWCAVELQSSLFIKSTPVSDSPHYDYRIRMINPLSFAEYQVKYFKNGSLVKRLQKNWHASGENDRRALIWNFWTVLVFNQDKLVSQSVALLNDADYQWNQSLPPDLWSEASLRKIRR